MTLALTKFEAVSRPIQGSTKKRGVQELRFTVTGAATDTLWDLDLDAGTFWTAAIADATYGAAAALALASVQRIVANSTGLRATKGEVIEARCQVVAGSEGALAFSKAVTHHRPSITWGTAAAPTSGVIVLELELADGIFPEHQSYG